MSKMLIAVGIFAGSLNSKNATMETISPIVSRISTSVQSSMTQIKALPAQGNKVTSDEVASGLNNVMQVKLFIVFLRSYFSC